MRKKLFYAMFFSALSVSCFATTSDLNELADTELSSVEGSGLEVTQAADSATHFAFDKQTSAGLLQASGDLKVLDQPMPTSPLINNTNILNLSGNAQSHLSSIVNVNAVNSIVQVLLNLNININSQVASMVQSNSAPRLVIGSALTK
jgi:hypothetical protein